MTDGLLKNHKLLIVEDSASLAITYQAFLRFADYSIDWVETLADARLALAKEAPDIVLLDIDLPDGDGRDFLTELNKQEAAPAVVVMTAYGSTSIAADCVDRGAFDFLTKPFNASRLVVTLQNARRHKELSGRVAAISAGVEAGFSGLLGGSEAMQAVYSAIERLAATSAHALVLGETGTGKMLAAEAIHRRSSRCAGPLLVMKCGELNADEVPDLLFGSPGMDSLSLLQSAQGGTLLIEDIGLLTEECQIQLLRFLRSAASASSGASSGKAQRAVNDVRILCTINTHAETNSTGFVHQHMNHDLYQYLQMNLLSMPPLRERGEDVLRIAQHLLSYQAGLLQKSFCGFSKSVEIVIKNHLWPGNIRQLGMFISGLVKVHNGALVTEDMLPDSIKSGAFSERGNTALEHTRSHFAHSEPAAGSLSQIEPLWQVEKRSIQNAIAICDGNLSQAARLLELSPSDLYERMQQWTQMYGDAADL